MWLLGPPCAQENPNAIPEGETPHNVTLLCYDPLTDCTKPGDRITVTGIYKARFDCTCHGSTPPSSFCLRPTGQVNLVS